VLVDALNGRGVVSQAAFDFETPTLPVARAIGEAAMRCAIDRADRDEPGFSERAKAFVIQYLTERGTASGEDITDACKAAGIVPADDRAFGPVYSTLRRRSAIAFAGFCARRKGHGTAGGCLWRLHMADALRPAAACDPGIGGVCAAGHIDLARGLVR
jgi:hypothetical protein